jgi:hypothetical protein
LKDLERRKNELLELEEVQWRIKSRALWIQERDNITNFFHNYDNHKKHINVIWNIRHPNGYKVSSFKEIA